MIYGIALSMRQFLDVYMPEASEVVLMRDGVKLSGRAKPYLTVQYLGSNDVLMAAGRTSYEEIFRFQVGIFAEDISQLLRLEEKTKTLLRRPDGIIRYTDDGEATEDRLTLNVEGFTPITNDDSSAESANHRGYFDVSATIYRHTGDKEFNQ